MSATKGNLCPKDDAPIDSLGEMLAANESRDIMVLALLYIIVVCQGMDCEWSLPISLFSCI